MKKNKGFTLIEVMIVVAMWDSGVAYPSYDEYVKRGNRTEGQAFLMDVAARQERYFSQNNAYITDTDDLAKLGVSASSPTGKYELSLSGGGGGYLLTATQQFNDTKCGNLTLNARGERGAGGAGGTVAECWR